jgi:hypothetical protein
LHHGDEEQDGDEEEVGRQHDEAPSTERLLASIHLPVDC